MGSNDQKSYTALTYLLKNLEFFLSLCVFTFYKHKFSSILTLRTPALSPQERAVIWEVLNMKIFIISEKTHRIRRKNITI